MKAIIHTKYGSPDLLQIKDVDRPSPKKKEVLVKIKATAINDYDWGIMRGRPHLYQLLFGINKPKIKTPGMELSGIVEEVGPEASSFQIGDEVYGDISDHGFGTFAEYVCIDEAALVKKPPSMSFEDAAAISHASMLAYQALFDIGKVQNGYKILVNGAGGGFGTFCLQLAKEYNVEMTGVDSGEKLNMMKSLGYDHVIDYKNEDFTKNGIRYDLVLDAKTNRSSLSYLRSLKPKGKYITVGGTLGTLFQLVLSKAFISLLTSKSVHVVALKTNKDLNHIHQLYEKGKIKPFIDGPYYLNDIPNALTYFGEGNHKGKIIIYPQMGEATTFN